MESILQKERECAICETTIGLECHHVIHGTFNRRNSEKYGLKIWVCRRCHEYIHRERTADLALIKMAQRKFEETHTRDEFRSIFGKNWL